MLVGPIYQYVYWQQFLGRPQQPDADNSFIAGILAALERLLAPVVEPS